MATYLLNGTTSRNTQCQFWALKWVSSALTHFWWWCKLAHICKTVGSSFYK